jgi:hypothetical protein
LEDGAPRWSPEEDGYGVRLRGRQIGLVVPIRWHSVVSAVRIGRRIPASLRGLLVARDPFARLLELFGASPEVLEEVRREEQVVKAATPAGPFRPRLRSAVANWLLRGNFGLTTTEQLEGPHFLADRNDVSYSVYVFPAGPRQTIAEKLDLAIRREGYPKRVIIVLGHRIDESRRPAHREVSSYGAGHSDAMRDVTVVLGVLREAFHSV